MIPRLLMLGALLFCTVTPFAATAQTYCDPDYGPCQPGTIRPSPSSGGTGSAGTGGGSGGTGSAGTGGGLAPQADPGGSTRLLNPLGGSGGPGSLEQLLRSILAFVIRIGTIVIVIMMVYVGYLFVVARGKPGELETARRALLYTVIGALILLGSQAIAEGIVATVRALGGG